MGFLPVGHTHEDIDQVFSCVSRHLKHRNALTIPGIVLDLASARFAFFLLDVHVHVPCSCHSKELTDVIRTSFAPEPTVVVIDTVIDVKGWMSAQTQALHDHLKAHQFKFEHVGGGECRMFYKEWSTDAFWLPESGLALLPAANPLPCSPPCVIKPLFDPDHLRMLQATIRKVGAYLKKACSESEDAASWWATWFEEAGRCVHSSEPQVLQGEH